jgi:hypothetical protein
MTGRIVLLGVFLWQVLSVSAEGPEGSDPLDWLRNSVPGEPGTDYPILSSIQETSFTCAGLIFGGYYADPEQDCQAYHVCLQEAADPAQLFPVSFLCPNGTVFNQEIFVCDWWFNVDCSAAVSQYAGVEGAFGGGGGGDAGDPGQCPAPGAGQECGGAVSNCWSPGQRDTDCPNNGLCCFDGCADLCVDGPAPAPRPPQVSPVEAEAESLPEAVELPAIRPPAPRPTVTEGYEYPVPELPLELPRPSPPPPGLPTLYGPPSI